MNDSVTPADLIAAAVRREREQAGISLSALAAKAGLAKSTLSQLEAGKGNPSIETLWAIAAALGVPFSFLFEHDVPQSRLIRADEGETLSAQYADFAAVLLNKCPPGSRRDLYRITLASGSRRNADPHPRGTLEHAFIASGTVRLGPLGAEAELGQGDYFCYPGDVPHAYEALSPRAVILLAMESNGGG